MESEHLCNKGTFLDVQNAAAKQQEFDEVSGSGSLEFSNTVDGDAGSIAGLEFSS